jgi:hypothetical protein
MRTSRQPVIGCLLAAIIMLSPDAATAQANNFSSALGRLFSTPLERALLDRMRATGGSSPAAQEVLSTLDNWGEDDAVAAEDIIPEHLEVVLTGSLQRGVDDFTFWINQQAISHRELPPGISVLKQGHQLALQISYQGGQVILRPGQRFHPASGTVTDLLMAAPAPAVTVAETPADTNAATLMDDDPVITPSGPAQVIMLLRDVVRYLQ